MFREPSARAKRPNTEPQLSLPDKHASRPPTPPSRYPEPHTAYEALLRVAEAVGTLSDLPTLLNRIAGLSAETVRVDVSALHLLEIGAPGGGCAPPDSLRVAATHGLRAGETRTLALRPVTPNMDAVWDQVRATRLYAAFSEAEGNLPARWRLLPACRAALTVPLIFQEEMIGCLSVGTRQRGQPFGLFELTVLAGIANQAAVAIQNARLYAQAQAALRAQQESQQRLVESERLRALGEMAAGVAHNFSNVMTGILANAQLARQQAGDPQTVARCLDTIERAAQAGQSTVERIRAFSSTRPDAPETPTDLSVLVRQALDLLRPQWVERTDLQVQADIAPLPPVRVAPAEVSEVVVNLLINAVQAMPDGGTLQVATFAERRSAGVRIVDTGSGMTPDVRARVFEPFFTTKGNAGSGLGLSTAYGTATRYRGTISLHTAPGRGTHVELRFPVANSD